MRLEFELTRVHWLSIVSASAGLGLLLWVCVTDLMSRTISNRVCLALATFGVLYWISQGEGAIFILSRSVAGAVGIVALSVLFAMKLIGGGDVELVGSVLIWLLPAEIPNFVQFTAVYGAVIGLITWFYMYVSKIRSNVPYGIAIACGAVSALTQRFF